MHVMLNVVTLYTVQFPKMRRRIHACHVECRDVVHGPVTKNDSGKSEPYIHVQ
jgi:hypothetical protein